jgi:hypothetical protein
MPIAGLEGKTYDFCGPLGIRGGWFAVRLHRKRAESDLRDGAAIIQGDLRDQAIC